jgi:hypothetical protein
MGTEMTSLEREREAHKAFADARCRVYIGREQYFTQIDEFMNGNHCNPLVIMGESGIPCFCIRSNFFHCCHLIGAGKSALVANWFSRVEEKEVDAFVFVHFIGSSAESASYVKLIRRYLILHLRFME